MWRQRPGAQRGQASRQVCDHTCVWVKQRDRTQDWPHRDTARPPGTSRWSKPREGGAQAQARCREWLQTSRHTSARQGWGTARWVRQLCPKRPGPRQPLASRRQTGRLLLAPSRGAAHRSPRRVLDTRCWRGRTPGTSCSNLPGVDCSMSYSGGAGNRDQVLLSACVRLSGAIWWLALPPGRRVQMQRRGVTWHCGGLMLPACTCLPTAASKGQMAALQGRGPCCKAPPPSSRPPP